MGKSRTGFHVFAGPAGVGKKTFALRLAQSLLCVTPKTTLLGYCGICSGCTRVASGVHPDLYISEGQVKIGDRLISEQIVPCWECRFCKRGEYWMCEKHDVYGFQNNVNGGFAEYMRYPKESINHQVPHDLPLEKAILVEPFACSAWCVKRADIQLDDVVVLAGAGTLGLGMVGCARLRNPKKLVVLDTRPERLELAKKFGADMVMNPLEEDVVKIVKEMTGGYGCDIYIEATGHHVYCPENKQDILR